MTQNQKVDNKNKKNKEENNTNASNANNANTTNEKKFSPNATVTSNLSGKGGDKKDKGKDKEKENINQNQPKEQPKPEQENIPDKDCKIGGPTKSTEINTYKPNFACEKKELIIKDYVNIIMVYSILIVIIILLLVIFKIFSKKKTSQIN